MESAFPVGRFRKSVVHANRGKLLENIIEISCKQYMKKNVAVIHRVPSEWIPIRDATGKIVTAKIQTKAAVDFMGHYQGVPIAFDAKSTKKDKWYLRYLESHQFEFLERWEKSNGQAYVLVAFNDVQDLYLVPFCYIKQKIKNRKEGGEAAIKKEELDLKFGPARWNKNGVLIDFLALVKNGPKEEG